MAELEEQQRRDTAELEKTKRQLDDANNIKSETLKKLRAMAAQMERDEKQLTELQRQVADGNGTTVPTSSYVILHQCFFSYPAI